MAASSRPLFFKCLAVLGIVLLSKYASSAGGWRPASMENSIKEWM